MSRNKPSAGPTALLVVCALGLGLLGAAGVHAQARPATQDPSSTRLEREPTSSSPDAGHGAIFATVGDQSISRAEYLGALRAGVRQKYYHGQVPEDERDSFQREVADQLVDRAVVLAEARRQGLQADQRWVAQQIERIEQRASRSAQWPQHRERVLSRVRPRLEEDSLVSLMQSRVRDISEPSDDTLRRYHADNPKRFTEPERFRVSAILLKVDPSSATTVWKAAAAEAEMLVQKIRAGASFADLARLHSSDASAERGGDMGYLHRGMLGGPAQTAVDATAVGAVTDPVKLLEGVAIFRVEERIDPEPQAFEKVRDRVLGLWMREQRDLAWTRFVERLREKVAIHINEQHYLWPAAQREANKM
ncbi:MAG: peptidylprolyl isomerase [Gammaproteobacteria bacterium]|nr:peptidylprolyl isomerase [Gammaproteobacteria bacterium]